MSRAYNFSAGPAALPEPVLHQARTELLEWGDARASVLEVSHRGAAFTALIERAEHELRALLAIPDDYAVLFVQGGATQQFALVPLNLAAAGARADYVISGHWSAKAAAEAAAHVGVDVIADSQGNGHTRMPSPSDWQRNPGASYLHYCPNETIHGVEFHAVPEAGAVPLVADMSSTLLSRPIDVARFGMIYAGAQKNIGPAGLTVLIVRRDLLARTGQPRANILSYAAHAAAHSMLNTPPTFAIYLAGLVLRWIIDGGGLAAMGERNRHKAQTLYAAIDGSGGFYRNRVDSACRSWMNVPFVLHDAALDAAFLAEATAAGLLGLKGHKAVGGMRASLYNAVPQQAVDALVAFMADFARRNG